MALAAAGISAGRRACLRHSCSIILSSGLWFAYGGCAACGCLLRRFWRLYAPCSATTYYLLRPATTHHLYLHPTGCGAHLWSPAVTSIHALRSARSKTHTHWRQQFVDFNLAVETICCSAIIRTISVLCILFCTPPHSSAVLYLVISVHYGVTFITSLCARTHTHTPRQTLSAFALAPAPLCT